MYTLEKIQKKFPEARMVYRGNGQAFTVNCWKYHRFGGFQEMEISEDGVFHCHNCSHSGILEQEFPEFFDPLQEMWPELFPPQIAPEVTVKSGPKVRRGGIMWSPEVQAPGEIVPFRTLPDNHVSVEYLRNRGFDIEELRSLDSTRAIYYCTKGQISIAEGLGSTTGRIIFPIYMSGKIVGWQARQIERLIWETVLDGEKEVWNGFAWRKFRKISGRWEDHFVAKYYTCPGMKRSSVLYGFDQARNYKEVAVVEGPLDYYMTGPQCVGTIGKHITFDQIKLLKTYWDRLFILRDPEINPHDPGFQKVLTGLSPVPVHHLALADKKDPGATPRESIWRQIAEHVFAETHTVPIGKN